MLLHSCRPTAAPAFYVAKYALALTILLFLSLTFVLSSSDMLPLFWGSAVFVILAFALSALRVKLVYDASLLELTEAELKMHTGIVNKSHKTIPLVRIQDTLVKRSLLERYFKVGQLFVSTAGSSGYELQVRDLKDADIEKILQIIKDFHEPQKPAPRQQAEGMAMQPAAQPAEPSPFLPPETKKATPRELLEMAEHEKERAEVLGEELLREAHLEGRSRRRSAKDRKKR